MKIVQKKRLEHVRNRRKREDMECKRRVKCVSEENKRKVDDIFGRKLREMFKIIKDYIGNTNKKGTRWNSKRDEVKVDNRKMVRKSEDVKGRWYEYFENK